MNAQRQAAIEYLRTPLGAPWKWDEAGGVIAWSDGTTIAFREEIEAIVDRLAPAGLPGFPTIVFVLAACRGIVPKISAGNPPTENESTRDEFQRILRQRQQDRLEIELSALSKLPPELISTVAGKTLLAEAVFEKTLRMPVDRSLAILAGLSAGIDSSKLSLVNPDDNPLGDAHFLYILTEALRPHTAESLQRRLRTGLDTLPVAAPKIELPRAERIQALLGDLAKNENHAGLALVVRDLMAAIHLPRFITHADEVSSGGASDIGNRGSLDRLLLSELAHDDLTLASRVALNEALYLRREPSARRPERGMVILLDVGLRMWGVPRVIGTAAALALLADHSSEAPMVVWRASGRALVAVDLLTSEGLENHLSVLELDLHPAEAASAIADAVPFAEDFDLVIVTHRETKSDESFRSRLAAISFARGFVLSVERDGIVELHRLPWDSMRPLSRLQLDVNKLFAVPAGLPASAPLIEAEASPDFPAIFRVQPFPLLLPVNAKIELAAKTTDGGLCVTLHRRLFEWKEQCGARELFGTLRGGKTHFLHRDSSGRIIVVKGRDQSGLMSVTILPSAGAEPLVAEFTGPKQPLAVWLDQGVVLLNLHARVVAVSLVSAEVLAETPFPPAVRWVGSRYFTDGKSLLFAAWSGNAVRWEPAIGGQLALNEIVTAFDCDGMGAWVLMQDGRLVSPTGHSVLNLHFKVSEARVCEQGNRLLVKEATKANWHRVDVSTRKVYPLRDSELTWNAVPLALPMRTMQKNFVAICAAPDGQIKLATKSGKWLRIFSSPQAITLVETTSGAASMDGEELDFGDLAVPPRFATSLKVATWRGGSKAWLDTRGLLHLRSHDPALPEISLVLEFQKPIAGWISTGQMIGSEFFTGLKNALDPQPLHDALRAFCDRLC